VKSLAQRVLCRFLLGFVAAGKLALELRTSSEECKCNTRPRTQDLPCTANPFSKLLCCVMASTWCRKQLRGSSWSSAL